MKTQASYPSIALTNLLQYANSSLPYPKQGTEKMIHNLEALTAAFLQEVRSAVETLPPADLPGYAKWLDKMISNFNCIYYEATYDPVSDTHKVHEFYPPLDRFLLQDQNPELLQLKHKLSHKAIKVQNRLVKYLDKKVWKLHPDLEEGRREE